MKWKKIKSHPHYEVSDSGIVRKTACKTVIGQWKKGGYPTVKLSKPRKDAQVHRLVAMEFLDMDDILPCVNHKDFDTENNNVSNLEWCTQSYNVKYSKSAGRYSDSYWKGKRSPSAKLSDETVEKIRKEYSLGGTSYQKLADKYGSSKRSVQRIINGVHYVRLQ